MGCVTGIFYKFDYQSRKQLTESKNWPLQNDAPMPDGENVRKADIRNCAAYNDRGNHPTPEASSQIDSPAVSPVGRQICVPHLLNSNSGFRAAFTSKDFLSTSNSTTNILRNSGQYHAKPAGMSEGLFQSSVGVPEREAQRNTVFEPAYSELAAAKEQRQETEDENDGCELQSSPVSMLNGMMHACEAGEKDVCRSSKADSWMGVGGEDDPIEWKESLRALARLQEMARNAKGDNVAPRASPPCAQGDRGDSARRSSFDFKEAIRRSQRSLQVSPRRSLDEINLPRSVVHLRDAIQARRDAHNNASEPAAVPSCVPRPAHRPPSVVARLMGLDDLSEPSTVDSNAAMPPPVKRISSEAKLLQQLLQYKPPPPSPPCKEAQDAQYDATSAIRPSPGNDPQVEAFIPRNDGERKVFADQEAQRPVPTQLHATSKRESTYSTPERHRMETSVCHLSASDGGRERSESGAASSKSGVQDVHDLSLSIPSQKRTHDSIPVVVLRKTQSQELFRPRPYNGFQEEIERRLRQLGLQSSQQDRKTLKQILDAMQLKGLLRRPHVNPVTVNENSLQKFNSVKENATCSHSAQPEEDQSRAPTTESKARPISPASLGARPVGKCAAEKKSESIVIMKPLAKSVDGTTAAHHCQYNAMRPIATEAITDTPIVHSTPLSRRAPPKVQPPNRKQNPPKVKGHLPIIEGRKQESASRHTRPLCQSLALKADSRDVAVKIKPRRSRELQSSEKSSAFLTGPRSRKSGSVSNATRRSLRKTSVGLSNQKTDAPCAVQRSPCERQISELRRSELDSNLTDFESLQHDWPISDCCAVSNEDVFAATDNDTRAVVVHSADQSKIFPDTETIAVHSGNVGGYDEPQLWCYGSEDMLADVRTPPRDGNPDYASSNLENAEKTDIGFVESVDQLSPVSVLDAQLCDMESEPSLDSPKACASIVSDERKATELEADYEFPLLQRRLTECYDVELAPPERSTEFRYAEQILKETCVPAECGVFPARWLTDGCKIRPELYLELEQEWDAAEDEHFPANDRDFGGELYMKSRQAAMRRRLVFDCLSQLLAGRLAWVKRPETMWTSDVDPRGGSQLGVTELWSDLQRLEVCPAVKADVAAAEDSVHEMLQRDLMQNVDYSDAWHDLASHSAIVARDLEGSILDTILEELMAELSCSRTVML